MNKSQTVVANMFFGIVLVIALVLYSWFLYKAYQLAFVPSSEYIKTVQRCGRVIDKTKPAVIDVHKHSADLEVHEYLYVDYDGRIEKEDVSADTWYKYKEGQRICFTSRADGSNWENTKVGLGGFVGWILILVTFIVLCCIVWHLIGGATLGEAIEKIFGE